MNLSITKILTFLDCPRKYWYLYEMGIQTPKNEGFYFGSAIHSGLESYYKGQDPMQGVAQALFGKKVSLSEEAKEGIDPYKLHKEAKQIFETYVQKAPYFKPKSVERFFEVELIHPQTQEKLPANLRGKMDLVTEKEEVVDHKTTSRPDSGYYDKKNKIQANGYSYAYFMMTGKLPKRFIFNQIVKGNSRKKPRIVPKILKPQLEDICSFFDICKDVLNAILEGKTQDCPKKNCWFCQFKDICSFNKKEG